MMKIERTFMDTDRNYFDTGPCSYARGWAQFDTAQDAPYFGTWVNPEAREILTYAEGDVTRAICIDDSAFIGAVRAMVAWAEQDGHGPAKIDALAAPDLAERFNALGLGDILH